MLLNDNKKVLLEVKSKLEDARDILNKQNISQFCLTGNCPFKVQMSARCLIGVLEEVCYSIDEKIED